MSQKKTERPRAKAKRKAVDQWNYGRPPDHGYYLAAWEYAGIKTVSELWFNPTTGWWTARGYLQYWDGQRTRCQHSVENVYAWREMPKAPASLNLPTGGART